MAYQERRELYKQIEAERDSKVIAYVTGDRPGLETAITNQAVDLFVDHLDTVGVVDRISLVLYTLGGDPHAARNIAILLQSFCDELEVIVPSKCYSAGTLMCLGANKTIMTKQARLGPIDTTVYKELNPVVPDSDPIRRAPVNVEDVNAFIEYAQVALPGQPIDGVFDRLAQAVHPLVLGNAFRVRAQTRMLGERLLASHMDDREAISRILDFLCTDSGSHDYSIGRREARCELGLPIETPSWDLYQVIKGIQDDFVDELELRDAYEPQIVQGDNDEFEYLLPRALIESVDLGAHTYGCEGTLKKVTQQIQPGLSIDRCIDFRKRDSWRFSHASQS